MKKCYDNDYDVDSIEIQFVQMKIMNDVKSRKNKTIDRMKIRCTQIFVALFWFTITNSRKKLFRNNKKFRYQNKIHYT